MPVYAALAPCVLRAAGMHDAWLEAAVQLVVFLDKPEPNTMIMMPRVQLHTAAWRPARDVVHFCGHCCTSADADMRSSTALQANVEMMLEYLPLTQFKAIYVVDLCTSLCKQARLKVTAKGWTNVHVVEGDACTFTPPGQATCVTFSYSLSSEY